MVKNRSAGRNIAHIFRYSTSHLSKTDKVRFFYALKGRDGKSGVLRATRSQFLAKSVLLVPKESVQDVKDFLRFWRCEFETTKVDLRPEKAESKEGIRGTWPRAALFVYDTSSLKKSELVRFYYALKGRDGKSGVLQKFKAKAIARAVVLVPIKHAAEIEDFFGFWKIPAKKMEVVLNNERA